MKELRHLVDNELSSLERREQEFGTAELLTEHGLSCSLIATKLASRLDRPASVGVDYS